MSSVGTFGGPSLDKVSETVMYTSVSITPHEESNCEKYSCHRNLSACFGISERTPVTLFAVDKVIFRVTDRLQALNCV